MKLHLVGFPHTRVTPDFSWCAYTSKIFKFTRMMRDYDVLLYAPEGSDPGPAELVEVLSDDERIAIFGRDDPNRLPPWPTDEQNAAFLARTIAAMTSTLEKGDLILLTMGHSQRQIADAFPEWTCVEPGVGYEGVLAGWRAFESYAWMHHIYGKRAVYTNRAEGDNVRWYDAVIPNYFDPADFPVVNEGGGDYLLFIGRLIERKGPHVAAEIAKQLGMKLVIAGAGATSWQNSTPDQPGTVSAPEITLSAPHLEYVGPIGVEERADLMAHAAATIVPTIYLEPFGGVAVESMMAGTPVVASDFGAYTETVQNGVSGYRFRTIAEACAGVEAALELDNAAVRDYALSRYSLAAVAPLYDEWFRRIEGLSDDSGGWYAPYKR